LRANGDKAAQISYVDDALNPGAIRSSMLGSLGPQGLLDGLATLFSRLLGAALIVAVACVYAAGVPLLIYRELGWRDIFDCAQSTAI
jgi:hypothetical protein